MPTPCVIRFTDDDGKRQAHAHRKQHGHPEEIITNLTYLHRAIQQQQVELSPGNVTAQFIFLDTVWYALWNIQFSELEDELWVKLFHPDRFNDYGESLYLRQHSILDSTTPIWPVPFLYEVEIVESEWQVRIGHYKGSSPRPVEEMFGAVEWGYDGDLEEAVERFQ